MRLIKVLVLAIFPIVLFAQGNALVGEWETKDKGETIKLVLSGDFTGSFDGISFMYVLEGKELVATYDYGVFHYGYELKNGLLTLKEGNLEHPYVFTKKKSLPVATSSASVAQPKLVDKNILGLWSNGGLSLRFFADGVVESSDGKKYTFETKNNTLQLFYANTFQENPYSVMQGYLSMVFNGEIMRLKKQESASVGLNEVRPVSPELAGKWCFVSNANAQMSGECMILTGDGGYMFTHEAKLDETPFVEHGEWWATSHSLYFLTPNGQSDTFQLSRKVHPTLGYLMLNINGRNFLSADQRTTW